MMAADCRIEWRNRPVVSVETHDGIAGPPADDRPKPWLFVVLAAALLVPAAIYLFYGIGYNLLVEGPGLLNADGSAAGVDFIAFYSAAMELWQHGPLGVYDMTILNIAQDAAVQADIDPVPFAYPPPYLFYVAPLAALPYIPALWAWLAVLTALCLVALWRLAPHPLTPAVALFFPALAHSFLGGQNALLTVALIAGGVLLLDRRPRLSGVLFGLMIFKPHVAVLIPLCLLAGRHYVAFRALAVTVTAMMLASVVAFGVEPWLLFVEAVPRSLALIVDLRVPWERMPTAFVTIFHLTGDPAAARAAQAASSVAAIVICLWVWRRTDDLGLRTLALAAAVPLVTPYAFDYDLAVLAVPIAVLGWRAWREGLRDGDLLLLIALWVAPLMLWMTSAAIEIQIGPIFFFALLVYVVRAVTGRTTPK
jgi:hypothetical protein